MCKARWTMDEIKTLVLKISGGNCIQLVFCIAISCVIFSTSFQTSSSIAFLINKSQQSQMVNFKPSFSESHMFVKESRFATAYLNM